MKLNIFKIPKNKVEDLKVKFKSLGLRSINTSEFGQWKANFYFSKDIDSKPIPWVEVYKDFFIVGEPENLIYFATYIWENDKYCFSISYGKSHFYLRQYCDHDFGTDIAKRIANKKDIRQKSSKKFAGKKKKEIKSYIKNTSLDIESGESIDYLQSSIIDEHKKNFGETGKFGSSTNLNPEIQKEKIANFLDMLIKIYESKELFSLPRTMIIDGLPETVMYDKKLVKDILSLKDEADFTSSSHDLVGVDFIFSGQEKYEFYLNGSKSGNVELSMKLLNSFITKYSIPEDQILNIRVKIKKEDMNEFSKTLKESIDYIVDGQNVILSQGKWMRFNEDYIEQLNEYIDTIDLEKVENNLIEVSTNEGDFNKNLIKYGYTNADKNFSIIEIKLGTLVEAWDSKKGDTVYAIKRGTVQKLGYVCDQANNTLELISKRANIKKIDSSFKNYCVWLIMQRQNIPKKISEIDSIIFKQKIESWARKSLELGITPKIKISKFVKAKDLKKTY